MPSHQTIKIKQATKSGFIECAVGGWLTYLIQIQKQDEGGFKTEDRFAQQ